MTFSTDGEVLVIGAGAMGTGIAQVAAAAGHTVKLYDLREGAARDAIDKTAAGLAKLVDRGRMSIEQKDALVARIVPISTLGDLSGVALVIEAVVEDLAVKLALFADIETRVEETTILASNTSSISITAIAAGLQHPKRFAGLHFFNPAPQMALVEVIAGLATDASVVEDLTALATAWGKTPVVAKSAPGFIVNRVARPFYGEALRVLQQGAADAATLDGVMRDSGGFRMGPFELMDLVGLDVGLAVSRSVHAAYFGDPRFTPSLLQQELVQAGRLGRKSGRGFFNYANGVAPPAPILAAPASAPTQVTIRGDLGPAAGLAPLLENAGIKVTREAGNGDLVVDGTSVALGDGRLASVRAAQDGIDNLVLFDLALDWDKARIIAIAPADGAAPSAVQAATGLFQALGKAVCVLDDVPGLMVARTVCMLANEAADAVDQGVASARDVDLAMTKGVNYPRGPLEWADTLGAAWVLRFIDNLAGAYGEDRYRASVRLRRIAARGARFHGEAS